MNASASQVVNTDAHRGGLFRLLSVWTRRYSREPASRDASARGALVAAISLYALETSVGEAAMVAAEAVADLAQTERREGRR